MNSYDSSTSIGHHHTIIAKANAAKAQVNGTWTYWLGEPVRLRWWPVRLRWWPVVAGGVQCWCCIHRICQE